MTGKIEKGTLIDRMIKVGYSLVNLISNKPTFPRQTSSKDGLVDSLRQRKLPETKFRRTFIGNPIDKLILEETPLLAGTDLT